MGASTVRMGPLGRQQLADSCPIKGEQMRGALPINHTCGGALFENNGQICEVKPCKLATFCHSMQRVSLACFAVIATPFAAHRSPITAPSQLQFACIRAFRVLESRWLASLTSLVLTSWWLMAAGVGNLTLDGTGNIDFEALYQTAMQFVGGKAEKKDDQGTLLFADLCEFLCAEFPDAASRQHFAQQLQELEHRCCDLLGAEVAGDVPVATVPAPPPPANMRPVGSVLPTYRMRLWQLGFAEEAAVRGRAPGPSRRACSMQSSMVAVDVAACVSMLLAGG